MGYKLSDIYLFSDFDGTIHSAVEGISERTLSALKRFTDKGGHFALATSRAPYSAKAFLDVLPINSPCLCVNGGAVYDMKTDEYIYTCHLPANAKSYVERIIAEHPELDAAVLTDYDYYYVANPDTAAGRMNLSNYNFNMHFERPIEGEWFKVVLNTPGDDAVEYVKMLNEKGYEGVRFTAADTYFVEMLPQHSSKGAAIEAMCEKLGINIDQTVAVGDYYNDVEMFRAAGYSACVQAAPDDIKEMVDRVLCSCEQGAVGELIEILEEMYVD